MRPLPHTLEQERPVGLIAAWGDYPRVVARALRRAGRKVCCIAVRDHADPAIEAECDSFRWISIRVEKRKYPE